MKEWQIGGGGGGGGGGGSNEPRLSDWVVHVPLSFMAQWFSHWTLKFATQVGSQHGRLQYIPIEITASQKWNKLQPGGFSQRNVPGIVVNAVDGKAFWTLMWNQHCPRPYVVSGISTQISIAVVYFRSGIDKNTFVDLSRSADSLSEVPHLSLDARLRSIGMLQGGATMATCERVYTMVTHLRSRFQTVCATSWSVYRLHAISARNVCNRLWGHNIRPCRTGV